MEEAGRGFTPEWDFLEDQDIKSLQNSLDESMGSFSQNSGSLKEKTEKFSADFIVFFQNALERSRSDKVYLNRVIKFIRKNLKILDLGGLSAGRSTQSNILSDANRQIIDLVGEDEYFKIVNELNV